jgi:DNA-binding transcriptional MerR regulator
VTEDVRPTPRPQPASFDSRFAAAQVCAIVGITTRQLSWWTRPGPPDPTTEAVPARHDRQQYSYSDLLMLMVVKRLLDAGLSMGAARTAMDALRTPGVDLTTANLVVDDRGSRLAYSGEEIMNMLKSARLLHIVPLGGVVSELATRSPLPAPSP